MHDRFNHIFGSVTHEHPQDLAASEAFEPSIGRMSERGTGGLGHYDYPVDEVGPMRPLSASVDERTVRRESVVVEAGRSAVQESMRVR